MRPERHLGAVEELHRGRAPDALGAGGGDLVARVELVEIELVGIGHADRRRVVDVLEKHIDQLEQGLGRLLFMREDEAVLPAHVGDPVIKAAAHIGRAALLAALEDDRAHPPGLRALLFEQGVDVALRPVEHEPHQLAAALWENPQLLAGEVFVIGGEARVGRRLSGGHVVLHAVGRNALRVARRRIGNQ